MLLCPTAGAVQRPQLVFDEFAAIRMSHSVDCPELELVAHDHYQGMRLACETAYARGFERIAFLRGAAGEARLDGRWTAAYLFASHYRHSPLLYDDDKWAGPGFGALVERMANDGADCMIATWTGLLGRIRAQVRDRGKLSRIVPVSLQVKEDQVGSWHGIRQNLNIVGRSAVDRLHARLLQGAYGMSVAPKQILISGNWHSPEATSGRTEPIRWPEVSTTTPGEALRASG